MGDHIPTGETELMMTEGGFVGHYRAMRSLLAVTEVGENMNKSWSVDFDAKVEIVEQERRCPVDRLTQYFLEEPASRTTVEIAWRRKSDNVVKLAGDFSGWRLVDMECFGESDWRWLIDLP